MAKKFTDRFPFLFLLAEKICLYSVALVPLVFLRSITTFSASKSFFIIAVSLLAFACMATLWLRDRSFVPRLPNISWVIGGYTLWIIITSLIGEDPTVSFWSTFERGSGIFSFIAVLLFSVTLLSIMRKKDIRRHLAGAYVWGGIILVFSKYLTILWPGKTFIAGDGGLMGNSSLAALYLLFPIAATIYLVLTGEKRMQKIYATLAGLFLITSPFFIRLFSAHPTLSSFVGLAQAGVLSLIVGAFAGILVWLYYSPRQPLRAVTKILCVISFLGLVAAGYFFFTPNSRLQKVFVAAASPTRILYGEIALENTAAHPAAGTGWNTYPLAYQRYFDPINLTDAYLKEGWVDKPHNILLEVAAAAGLPGLALYLLFYGIILTSCVLFVRRGYFDRRHGALFFGLFIAYLLQTIFLFEAAATQFIFFATLALLFSYMPSAPRTDSRPLIASKELRKSIIGGLWIAVAIGIFYFSYRPAKESVLLHTLQAKTAAERTEQMNAVFALSPLGRGGAERARLLSFYAGQYLQELPSIPRGDRTAIQTELKAYLTILESDMADGDGEYFRTYLVASMTASDIFAYSIDKKSDAQYLKKARDYATHAIELSPRNQQGYLELAKTYVLAGETAKAIPYLQMSVALAPGFRDAHIVLLNVIRATGNETLFAEKFKEAQAAIPGFTYP